MQLFYIILIIKRRYAKIIDSFALSSDFYSYYNVVPELENKKYRNS